MPLDGHAHLISQGWQGKGSGLRHGAINRPVVVTQKKTLSGVGKDRDEAFPFWDHVFEAAASAIKVKVYNDSDTEDTDDMTPTITFQRTSTGIISNRRPVSGTPATHSGTATPSPSDASGSSTPKMSIMSVAKQEAARRALYSMFFRGPILGADIIEDMLNAEVNDVVNSGEVVAEVSEKMAIRERKRKLRDEEARKSERMEKTRKGKEVAVDNDYAEDEAAMADIAADGEAERKRRKTSKKEKQAADAMAMEGREDIGAIKPESGERMRLKAERRARKEKKWRRKEEKRAVTVQGDEGRSEPASSSPTLQNTTEVKQDGKEKSKRKRKAAEY